MRTPNAGETRYEKKFEEAMVLANLLAMTDLHVGARFRSWELSGMPDFTGIIAGRELSVEIANVTESSHADAVLAVLKNRLESVPIAPGRFVSISFLTVPLPPKLDIDAAVRDIGTLAADPTLRSFEHVSAGATELARIKAKIRVDETAIGTEYIDVSSDAHSYSPVEMLPLALKELADKRRCAERYKTGLPLWLILHITDVGLYAKSIKQFEDLRPTMAPIERVFLTDGVTITDSATWG